MLFIKALFIEKCFFRGVFRLFCPRPPTPAPQALRSSACRWLCHRLRAAMAARAARRADAEGAAGGGAAKSGAFRIRMRRGWVAGK